MKDASHPIWALARLAILMLSLVTVLYLNASNFDKTELQTIITMFMVAAGTEGLTQYLKGVRK